MLTRREILIGAATAGAVSLIRGGTGAFATASQPTTPVNFAVPAHACDCHTHIFDPARFPVSPSRVYTPEPASVAEMRALHRALHTGRVVIVTPSAYGSDNAVTLDALKQFGSIARGVAVIDDKTTGAALDAMGRAGIRGIRVNLETAGQTDPAVCRQRFAAASEWIKGRSTWHMQIYTRLSVIEAIQDLVMAAPMPVVFDHFGGAQGPLGVDQPGFSALANLLHAGKAYVKISAPYRSSSQPPNYPDVAPLAKALIAANPQRILWGSDWPHPHAVVLPGHKLEDPTPPFQIDDGAVFNQLPVWAPEAAVRKTILVENPAKLYGY